MEARAFDVGILGFADAIRQWGRGAIAWRGASGADEVLSDEERESMKAMLLRRVASLAEEPQPLVPAEIPIPEPGAGEIRIRGGAAIPSST